MTVELNANFLTIDTDIRLTKEQILSLTPPIDESYWIARVPVSEQQAVVCFPKFFTVGIGFQHETDWNTNLPYTTDAAEIFDHIAHNKGDDSISDAACIEAIQALQETIKQWQVKR